MFLVKLHTLLQHCLMPDKFTRYGSIMLVPVFSIGYLLTASTLDGYALSYFCNLLLILLATTLMLRRVGPPSMVTAPLWLCLGYFLVSYCLKFFLILLFPSSPAEVGTVGPLCLPVEFKCQNTYVFSLAPYDWTTIPAEARAIALAAICITGFCLVASIGTYSEFRVSHRQTTRAEVAYAKVLLIFAVFFSVATAVLFYQYNIGLMGSIVKIDLPYKFRGIVYFLRTIMLPGMLYLSIYISYRSKSFITMVAGLALLLCNGGLDVVFRSSRSALFYPLLGLFLLALSAEVRLRFRTLMWSFVGILPVCMSIPYVSSYRVNRLELDTLDALVKSIIETGFNPFVHIGKGLVFVFYRFTGVDVLASMLGHEALPIGSFIFDVLRSERGVSGYLSTAVFGTPADYPGASAPGFVGWWYLVGGVPGVLLGGALLALTIRYVWGRLLKIDTPTIVIARVFFLLIVFLIIIDGTVDTLRKMFLVMLFTLVSLELGARLITGFVKFYERRVS